MAEYGLLRRPYRLRASSCTHSSFPKTFVSALSQRVRRTHRKSLKPHWFQAFCLQVGGLLHPVAGKDQLHEDLPEIGFLRAVVPSVRNLVKRHDAVYFIQPCFILHTFHNPLQMNLFRIIAPPRHPAGHSGRSQCKNLRDSTKAYIPCARKAPVLPASHPVRDKNQRHRSLCACPSSL